MTRDAALENDIDAFLGAYRRLLLEGPGSGDADIESERRRFAELLDDLAGLPVVAEPPVKKPVCRFLDPAHAPPDDPLLADLTKASLPLAERAVWRNRYRPLPGREALFQNFAFCDFVGPEGWLHSPAVTLGLTMLGPYTDYPFHQHPARELYLLLSGVSGWAVDSEPYDERRPGDWLLHREMQLHAIRSGDAPMLAVSAWRGDIHMRSRFQAKSSITTIGDGQ